MTMERNDFKVMQGGVGWGGFKVVMCCVGEMLGDFKIVQRDEMQSELQ